MSPPRPNHVSAPARASDPFRSAVVRCFGGGVPDGFGAFSVQVSVVRVTSGPADVVVREASPPLRGAKVSKSSLAVEVPDEVVAREASPPLHGARASKPPSYVDQASDRALKEALTSSHEAKAYMAPPAVPVDNEVAASSGHSKDSRYV